MGDLLVLRTHSGSVRYEVRDLLVAHGRDVDLLEPTEDSRLTLITCYPFGGLTRSDLRYVAVLTPARRSPEREALRAPPA